MRRLEKTLLFLVTAALVLPNYGWCMPRHLMAVNNFVANHPYLSKKSFMFICSIDDSERAYLVYYEPVGDGSKASINFVSFNPDGTLRLGPKQILENHWEFSLHENESSITVDAGGNIHLILRDDKRSLENPLQTYMMVDSLGNLKRQIEIEKPFLLSSVLILGDGTLVIHGVSGRLNEIVLVSGEDKEKFESFSVETPELGYGLANARGQIYDLGDHNILFLSLYSSPYLGRTLIRRIMIDLDRRRIVDAEELDAREAASIFYYNTVQNISYIHSRIFPVGDKIAYLCGLPSLADRPVPSDSMCVILFDSQGKLIKSESKESYPMVTGVLTTFEKNDFLIRNNRDAFGYVKFTGENRLSLYGLTSLRNFPRIIIDPGLE